MKTPPVILIRFCCLLGLTLLLTGCPSIRHATVLRDLQREYNEVTKDANQSKDVSPLHGSGATDLNTKTRFIAVPEPYNDYWLRYAALANEVEHLNKEAGKELKQDGLYANARVLEILSKKQQALYEGILVAGDEATVADRSTVNDVKNLARKVRTELQADTNAVIHPRNQFTLLAIEPLLRYDNALVRALRAYYAGEFSTTNAVKRTTVLRPIIKEIAVAEQQLAELPKIKNFTQVKGYLLLARLRMLNNAGRMIKSAWESSDPPDRKKAYVSQNFKDYLIRFEQLKKDHSKYQQWLGELSKKERLFNLF